MTTDLFIGMDISSFKVDICVLPCELSISIRDFYESEDFKKAHKVLPYDIDSVDYIASLKPTVVILEPTGKYGQFWIENLRDRNVPILVVNQSMVKETRKSLGGSDSKDDPYDCLILLQCYFQHYVRQFNRLYWVIKRSEKITAIRRCLLDIQSIIKKRTQCINTVKQRLKVEHPAKSEVSSVRINGTLHPDILPSFWAWVAEWFECRTWKIHQGSVTKYRKEYEAEMERGNGSGITPLTRQYAYQICLWHQSEAMLEMELKELMLNPEFKTYLEVFSRFGFGLREKAWILVKIHPFEQYLCVPKFRGKRRFRQALGCGRYTSQSGKQATGTGGKRKGSGEGHSILFQFVVRAVERGLGDKLIKNDQDIFVTNPNKYDVKSRSKPQMILRDYYVKKSFNLDGKKKRGQALGDARNATTRKVAEVIFEELCREWNK